MVFILFFAPVPLFYFKAKSLKFLFFVGKLRADSGGSLRRWVNRSALGEISCDMTEFLQKVIEDITISPLVPGTELVKY